MRARVWPHSGDERWRMAKERLRCCRVVAAAYPPEVACPGGVYSITGRRVWSCLNALVRGITENGDSLTRSRGRCPMTSPCIAQLRHGQEIMLREASIDTRAHAQ